MCQANCSSLFSAILMQLPVLKHISLSCYPSLQWSNISNSDYEKYFINKNGLPSHVSAYHGNICQLNCFV